MRPAYRKDDGEKPEKDEKGKGDASKLSLGATMVLLGALSVFREYLF